MADGVELSAGTGGAVINTDDITSVHTQIVKTGFGALDSLTLAASGAGAVSAGVQRVTLASDDPAVTDLAAIEVLLTTIAGDTTDIEAALETAGGLVVNLGANNDVTVTSGTVDLGATDNAVLDAIAASVAAIDTDATTIIGHVDGIEGLLTTIDADTGSILTAVQLLDNAVYVDDADWTGDTSSHLLVGGLYQSTPQTVTDGDVAPFNITANGALHVSDAGGSLTVDGTVTANLSATDNAVLDNIDADLTTIIGHVDGIETLIGTTNTTLTTIDGRVDGIEGLLTTIDADTGSIMTAVQLIDDAVQVLGTDTYTEATSKGITLGAVRRDADTTLVNTTNEFGPLQMDANGRLKVEAFSGETLPVSLASVPSHAVTNAGTFAVQVDGAALTALQLIDNTILVDDAAFTPGTSSVTMAGFQADEASTDSVNEGDAGAARMTLDRKVIVTPQPHTSGGLTPFKSLDIDESEEEIKATAGQLYEVLAFNETAAPLYLKFYNATAANVSVGTTTPLITLMVPGNADSDGAGFVMQSFHGYVFDTAISVACTTGIADADTGAPGANDCMILVGYK